MNQAELKLVEAMPPWRRVAKFRPMFKAGTITEAQYDFIIQRIPYTTAIQESGEVGTDIREYVGGTPNDGTTGHDAESGERCGEIETTPHRDTATPSMERIDPLLVRGDTDAIDNRKTDKGNHKSQKQRILDLLSDGEWHTNTEIMQKIYDVSQGGYCNYKARIDELRNEHHNIPNAVKVGGKVYRYRLIKKDPVTNTFYGGK